MIGRLAPWGIALLVAAGSAAFALGARLPLPFDGFATLVAATGAFVGTVTLGLLLPASWLWSDAERLHHAFRARHGLSDTRTRLALDAITAAHGRATALRAASARFADDLRDQTGRAADALDAAARDIFYDPETLASHRATLVRSELIEEAVVAHARMRAKSRGETIEAQIAASRGKVSAALASLEEALASAEGRAANRLLTEVGVASETAETLLRPRSTTMSSSRISEDH
ncbi:MAG: hypothetical protein QNJ13_01155 [Paracoccaceae bacterium]|nr:hypothetical protein [Paracoccaceae bacterium]